MSARAACARAVVAIAALAIVTAAVAPSCGRKSAPKPPELVVPARITSLNAANQADGILLSWSRPRRRVDGSELNDLGGFTIERTIGTDEAGFELLTTIELTDQQRFRKTRQLRYLDHGTEAGTTYFYRVIAFTTDGYRSEPSNVAALARAVPPTPEHAREKSMSPTPR